jgi:hypothetical protein
MKSKHKFTPDQVVPMEERALLSSLRASLILTTTRLSKVESQVNTAIVNFEKAVLRAFNKDSGFTDAFNAAVGVTTLGMGPPPLSYASGSLLANLDRTMGSLEFQVPFGAGSNPTTGGIGLSNKTNLTTFNPAEPVDPVTGATDSVAELMETEITSATDATTLKSNMNQGRAAALTILPGYVKAFDQLGTVARVFILKR